MMRAGEFGKKAITAISKAESKFTKTKSRSVLKFRDCIGLRSMVMIILSISLYTVLPLPHK